ncbi:MAG: phosphate signaling complex protein PhoU [Bacillaceae bacterium]|nr:phosphate signaling complex protein PhoU [Bacillaceae bacterium]
MQTREHFHTGLTNLKKNIIMLGQQAEGAFTKAFNSFINENSSFHNEIKTNDQKINQLEISINEQATLLIVRQQPVASDLRKIIVAFKISSDLERIGDLAVDISKAASRISKIDQFDTRLLVEMADKAKHMLNKVFEAYETSNVLAAQQVAHLDDEIDKQYSEFMKMIFEVAARENIESEQVTQLAFIARYIERVGDYATNISESIIYEVNGQYYDLN